MEYEQFERKFAGFLKSISPATRRKWKQRGIVPEKIVALQGVTNVTNPPIVTPPKEIVMVRVADDLPGEMPPDVAVPSAEKGHEEFDIMSDGWARGFGKDSPYLRTYRTAHAIRRFAEKRAEDFRTKALTQEFWEKHSGTQESRLAFFKKLAGVK